MRFCYNLLNFYKDIRLLNKVFFVRVVVEGAHLTTSHRIGEEGGTSNLFSVLLWNTDLASRAGFWRSTFISLVWSLLLLGVYGKCWKNVFNLWARVPERDIKDRGSNFTPQILWNIITCPCPWYMRLVLKSPFVIDHHANALHNTVKVQQHIIQDWIFLKRIPIINWLL